MSSHKTQLWALLVGGVLIWSGPANAQVEEADVTQPPPPTPAATTSSEEERVTRAQEQFAQEPSLVETRRAALNHFRVSPGAIAHVRNQLRTKAGAPYVIMTSRFERYGGERNLVITPQSSGSLHETDGNWRYTDTHSSVTMGWNLPDRVFTPAEFQTYRLTAMHQSVFNNINNIYFSRRQLVAEYLINPPEGDWALSALRIRIQGCTTLLDSFTGGWFSANLPEGSI